MDVIMILIYFLLPAITAIVNVINARKNGKKGVWAFLVTVIFFLLTVIITGVLSNDVNNAANAATLQLVCLLLMILSCLITFIYCLFDGFANIKSADSKKKRVGLIAAPLCAVIIMSVPISIVAYEDWQISQIKNNPSWAEKVRIAQQITSSHNAKALEAMETLKMSLLDECPDIESLCSRSIEDLEIYDEYAGGISFGKYNEKTRTNRENSDSIFTVAKKIAEYDTGNEKIVFIMPEIITPQKHDGVSSVKAHYDNNMKYVIVSDAVSSVDEENEYFLSNDTLELIPIESMPERENELDIIIVISNYFVESGGYYNFVKTKPMDRTTNICAYDYKTGRLVGVIGHFFSEAPSSITYNKENPPDFSLGTYPKLDVNECLRAFFNDN